MDELRAIASISKPNLICITETWLNNDIEDSLISISNYSVCRSDRMIRKGGGCAIYVENVFAFEQLPCFEYNFLGIEGVMIRLVQPQLFIMCLYVPPNVPSIILNDVIEQINLRVDEISNKFLNHEVVICGDLNKLNVKELCDYLDLQDIVTKPTRKQSILDHLLISRELRKVYNADEVCYDCPLGNSDHNIITAFPTSLAIDCAPNACISLRYVYDFRQSNIDFLLYTASLINWEKVTDEDCIDKMWYNLQYCLQCLMELCIPVNEVYITENDKQWITPLIKHLINERWKAYRVRNWSLYNHLKIKVKHEIIRAKRSWANKLQTKSYGIWKLKKHFTNQNRNQDFSFLLKQYGSVDNLIEKLTEFFRDLAAVQHDQESDSIPLNAQPSENSTLKLPVTEMDIKNILSRVALGKAPGCDCLPNKLYVLLKDFIAKPLATICETSFSRGKFPSGWKHGIIIPVPKQRLKSITDVRPITLNPLPSKICEKLIKKHFLSLFEENYGASQHGFRRGSSTTSALIQIMDASLRNFDDASSSGTAIVSLDLSKAFDSLDHKIILSKLQQKGFSDGLIGWISDYLQNRTAVVKIGNNISHTFPVQRGIPQGTVLGPLIFCTFVADFAAFFSDTTIVKYADDTNFIINLSKNENYSMKEKIEKEISHAISWCVQNKLKINANKSSVLLKVRQPNNRPISLSFPVKEEVKILGVHLNNKLDWTSHIDNIYKSANRRFHVLKQMKSFICSDDLHRVYVAYIRSIIDFSSVYKVEQPSE